MSETLESLRASFNRSLRVEGKADRTLVLYGQSITYFSHWLGEKGLPADLSNLTRDNVLHWLDGLRARGLASGTIRTRWRGLRRFVNWLVAEDILAADPLAGIVVDKPEPPSVPILTDGELTALVNACKGKNFNDLRDVAVIRLLIDCGIRVSELTGIDTKDLDLDGESVQVTGKGSRVRVAYFGSKTGLALDRYLRARRAHRHAADPALFLGERGRFTPDGVRERLKVRADRAGLDSTAVHPHRFRHTHAHDFLLAGGQERDLMRRSAGAPRRCSAGTGPVLPTTGPGKRPSGSSAVTGYEWLLTRAGKPPVAWLTDARITVRLHVLAARPAAPPRQGDVNFRDESGPRPERVAAACPGARTR